MKVYVMKKDVLGDESALRSLKLNEDCILVYPTLECKFAERLYEVAKIISTIDKAAKSSNLDDSDDFVKIGDIEKDQQGNITSNYNGAESGYITNDERILTDVIENLSNIITYDDFMSRKLRYYFKANYEILGSTEDPQLRDINFLENDVRTNAYRTEARNFIGKEEALRKVWREVFERKKAELDKMIIKGGIFIE